MRSLLSNHLRLRHLLLLCVSLFLQYSNWRVCLNAVMSNLQYSSHSFLGYCAALDVFLEPTEGSCLIHCPHVHGFDNFSKSNKRPAHLRGLCHLTRSLKLQVLKSATCASNASRDALTSGSSFFLRVGPRRILQGARLKHSAILSSLVL